MPKLSQRLLKCAFYLYPTVRDAQEGGPRGATGFFVSLKTKSDPSRYFTYAVSNHHALTAGSTVIRLNRKDGRAEIHETDPSDWTFTAGGADLAVLPVGLSEDEHDHTTIPEQLFASPESVSELGIGPGDDVFMIGRFVNHDGGIPNNRPAVRFGHISVDPTMMHFEGRRSLSYVLDVHSRTGYSGSPVFFYRTPGSDLSYVGDGGGVEIGNAYVKLLAVHYAQFPETWELASKPKKDLPSEALPLIVDEEKHVIVGVSGMTCAIPAWVLRDLLNDPSLVQIREAEEERLLRAKASGAAPSHL